MLYVRYLQVVNSPSQDQSQIKRKTISINAKISHTGQSAQFYHCRNKISANNIIFLLMLPR